MTSYGTHREGLFVIGDGVGIVGRWARLFFGLNGLLYSVLNPLLLNPLRGAALVDFAIERSLGFVAIVIIYMIGFYLFGRLLFQKLSPWAGTAVFLGIPTLLRLIGILPDWAGYALGTYISFSLVLTFFMKYGGCEVVALPSMLFAKRYTMYCPLNAMDCVERAVTPDAYSTGHKLIVLVSLGITSLVGGYYYILSAGHAFSRFGLVFEVDYRFSWLLAVPFFYAAYMAIEKYREHGRWLAPAVRKYGMGAFILLLMVVNYGQQSFHISFWHWILAAGTAYVLVDIGLVLIGKRKLREA